MGTSKRYTGKIVKSSAVYGESGEYINGTAYDDVKDEFVILLKKGTDELAFKLLLHIINKSGGPTIIANCLAPEVAFVFGVFGTWYGLDIKGYEWVKYVKFAIEHKEEIYKLLAQVDDRFALKGESKSEVVIRKSFYETLENLQLEDHDNIDKLIKNEFSEYISSQLYYQILNDLEYLIETRKLDINTAESNLLNVRSIMNELILNIMEKYSLDYIQHNLNHIYEIIFEELEVRLSC